MADKSFGVKQLNLIGASGTPNITSPNNLNINAVTVAISTDVTIGGQVTSNFIVGTGRSVGIGSTQPQVTLVVNGTTQSQQLNVTGVSTFNGTTLAGTNNLTGTLSVNGASSQVSFSANKQLVFGAADLIISSDGTKGVMSGGLLKQNYLLIQNPTNSNYIAKFQPTIGDGSDNVELYYGGNKTFETIGAGASVTGTTFTNQLSVSGVSTFVGIATFSDHVYLTNQKSLYFGNKFDILQNGSTQSIIRSQSGNTIYLASGSAVRITDTTGTTISAIFNPSTDVALRYASSTKFLTTNTGVTVNGQYEIGGTQVLNANTLGSGVVNSSLTGVGTLTQLSVSGVSTLSSLNVGIGGTIITTTSSGLVGIGTTNPKATLEVVGSMVADGIDIRNLPRTQLVSYASASEVSNSALSISGISSYTLVGSYSTTYSFSYSGPAISADGGTIIVGDWNANDTGATYVYNRVGAGNSIVQVGVLTAGIFASSGDAFGYSVATSADGKTIAVGALGDQLSTAVQSGSVYIFDRIGNSFNQVGILTGVYSTVAYEFGERLVVSGDGKTILVGAPTDELSGTLGYGLVYVFDRIGNSFNQVGILTGSLATNSSDRFGDSVATSYDGKSIIVGAPNDEKTGSGSGSGVVYVFDRIGNSFNQVGILTGSFASDASDSFGSSVATSVDGKSIVVGAQYDETGASLSTGVVYVFDRTGNSFDQVGILTSSGGNVLFGHAVSASADGKTIASYPYGGSYVSIHKREGNSFNEVTRISYTGNLAEQQKISLTADGKTLILSNEQGVYVHDEVKDTYLYSGPTGNIGIGTTNPTSKLHVVGGVRVAGTVTATSFVGDGSQLTGINASSSSIDILEIMLFT